MKTILCVTLAFLSCQAFSQTNANFGVDALTAQNAKLLATITEYQRQLQAIQVDKQCYNELIRSTLATTRTNYAWASSRRYIQVKQILAVMDNKEIGEIYSKYFGTKNFAVLREEFETEYKGLDERIEKTKHGISASRNAADDKVKKEKQIALDRIRKDIHELETIENRLLSAKSKTGALQEREVNAIKDIVLPSGMHFSLSTKLGNPTARVGDAQRNIHIIDNALTLLREKLTEMRREEETQQRLLTILNTSVGALRDESDTILVSTIEGDMDLLMAKYRDKIHYKFIEYLDSKEQELENMIRQQMEIQRDTENLIEKWNSLPDGIRVAITMKQTEECLDSVYGKGWCAEQTAALKKEQERVEEEKRRLLEMEAQKNALEQSEVEHKAKMEERRIRMEQFREESRIRAERKRLEWEAAEQERKLEAERKTRLFYTKLVLGLSAAGLLFVISILIVLKYIDPKK